MSNNIEITDGNRAKIPRPAECPVTTLSYLHPDHLGTVRTITDASQTVIWRWDSAPFGRTAPDEDPDGDGQLFSFNLRFPGQLFDPETGLHYNYFRDYDPSTGRYVQSDPIGLRGGLNTYAYVSNNPLKYIDPLGLTSLTVCVCENITFKREPIDWWGVLFGAPYASGHCWVELDV